jgi:hypothetical protein
VWIVFPDGKSACALVRKVTRAKLDGTPKVLVDWHGILILFLPTRNTPEVFLGASRVGWSLVATQPERPKYST